MNNTKLKKLQEVLELELTYNKENKAQFKKASTAFLKDIGEQLKFSDMRVSFNPGGIAVPGSPSLYGMWADGNGIMISICAGYMYRKNIMYRTISDMEDYTGSGSNRWTSLDEGTEELLETFLRLKKETV